MSNQAFYPIKSRCWILYRPEWKNIYTMCSDVNKHSNLSKKQCLAVDSLKNNSNLFIRNADKDGSVVVMDSALYRSSVVGILENQKNYKTLLYFLKTDSRTCWKKGLLSGPLQTRNAMFCFPWPQQSQSFTVNPRAIKVIFLPHCAP